jgi:hypothetical protein
MGETVLRRVVAGMLALALIGAAGCGSGDAVIQGGTAEVATDDPPDPGKEARRLVRSGKYDDAIARYEDAGLVEEADRVRRRGARTLARSAQRALARGRHTTAKRLATRSRRLRRTTAARTIIRSANAQIARAAVAERERQRLARIARDQRTCSAAEKRIVGADGGIPPGCADFAARQAQPESPPDCDPNYEDACLKPDSADYDCEGGSGDGPDYTGPVRVVGEDPHGLDADGDGIGCQNS